MSRILDWLAFAARNWDARIWSAHYARNGIPSPLEDATRAFYSALNDILGGDATAMLELWSHADDVTYMSPFGELLVGWDPVRASWQARADQLLGGHVDPEELHHFASETLGFVVGFEHEASRSTVRLRLSTSVRQACTASRMAAGR